MYGELNQGFLKTDHGLPSDSVYYFFELVSYQFQGERGKYMNLGKISWLHVNSNTNH